MSGQFVGSRASWAHAPAPAPADPSNSTLPQQPDASPIKFSSPPGGRQRPVRRYSARKSAAPCRSWSAEHEPEVPAAPSSQPEFVFQASGMEHVQGIRATKSPRKPSAKKPVVTKAPPSTIPIYHFGVGAQQQQQPQPTATQDASFKPEDMAEDMKIKLSLADQPPVNQPAFIATTSLQQPQQQQPAFVFRAGSADQQPPAEAQPQQPSAPPADHQPQPQQPQRFVFQAQQPQQQQQQPEFVSIKEIGKTPRAPLRSKYRRRAVAPSKESIPPTALSYDTTIDSQQEQQQQQHFVVPEGIHAHRPPTEEEAKKAALEQATTAAADLRGAGNEAFRQQQYKKAYNLYTKAAEAVWPFPELHRQLALLLCNRAAASLSLGHPLKALHDCRMGLQHDPNYAKCVLRMATCHVRMGNFARARAQLQKLCKAAEGDVGLATEVQAKSQEISEIEHQLLAALQSLGHKLPSSSAAPLPPTPQLDTKEALAKLETLFSHTPHSEILHAAKAGALLSLGRFSEAKAVAAGQLHAEGSDGSPPALWRMWLITQASFHVGDVETTEKQIKEMGEKLKVEQGAPGAFGGSGKGQGEPELEVLAVVVPLPSIEEIQEFLGSLNTAQKAKNRGNAAVKSKDFKAAVEAYTEALAVDSQSAAMAGVLHSNRAAAYQGLGDVALALADCCRAKALAPGFAKAHSRMATLLSDVHLYSAAADELRTALALPDIDSTTRRDYSKRYKEALEASNKDRAANHYKLLGVERQSSLDQIRKSYKKLALQLHPDKAIRTSKFSSRLLSSGVVLVDSEGPMTRLRENATWLFKSLGEAHDVLTDDSKRQEYDADLAAAENARRYGGEGMYGGGFGGGEYVHPYHSGFGGSSYYAHGFSTRPGYGQPRGYGGYGGFGSYNYGGRANGSAYGGGAQSSSSNTRNSNADWGYWSYH